MGRAEHSFQEVRLPVRSVGRSFTIRFYKNALFVERRNTLIGETEMTQLDLTDLYSEDAMSCCMCLHRLSSHENEESVDGDFGRYCPAYM